MSGKKREILPSINPPGPQALKEEIRNENQDKRKIFDPGGIWTSGLEHRRSTNWGMMPGWVTLWSKYSITLFVMHAKTGWLGRTCLDLYYHRKHVKDTINHQLLKFTLLRLVSYVAVIYFGPQGQREQRRGKCPWGFSCFRVFFWVVTCPRPPVFTRPNKYVLQTFGQH